MFNKLIRVNIGTRDLYTKVLEKAKSYFDTRRVYLLLRILSFLPMTDYLQKLFYLRLRMPWTAQNFSDKILGGFATVLEEMLMGKLNEISFDEAVEKFRHLKSGELSFLLEQFITVNPALALELYKNFRIENKRYHYLNYALNTDEMAESFFDNCCKEESDACLNRYDYFLRNGNTRKSKESLNSYFQRRNLESIVQTTDEQSLYIDNMTTDGTIDPCKAVARISIIMTVKDEEQLIPYALESIFRQSYQNIELILVDDGSVDSTLTVFRNICNKYDFCNYIIISMECNVGTFICKNVALQHATGELITFHDADDWSHPQKLQLQAYPLIEKHSVASVSNMVRIRPDGTIFSKPIYPPHSLCMISLIFRREVFEKLGFFRTGLFGADAEYYERIIAYYGQADVCTLSDVLTLAAHRSGSLTTSSSSDYGISPIRAEHWEKCRQLQVTCFKTAGGHYVPFDSEPAYHINRGMV